MMTEKYCNVTFVKEGTISFETDDVAPMKLLRCSRCQETFYRGKEEQRAHWKIHKKVCKVPPEDEVARVGNLSMDEAASELMGLLRDQNFKAGSIWVLLMRRIYHLFRNSNDRSECFNEEILTDTFIGSGKILSCARQLAFASNSDMELLWATPGFANFQLSVELIADGMLDKKQRRWELSDAELMPYEFNPKTHTDAGLANLMVLFLMAGAVGRTRNTMPNLANYTYRKTGYASAAFQKMVCLWTDPYTRASLVLKKNQVTSVRQEWFPMTVMNVIDQSPTDHPLYIGPGLSVYDAVKTVLEEGYAYSPLRVQEMVSCLIDSCPFEKEAWRNFSATDRAECAILVVKKYMSFKDAKARGSPRLDINLAAELASVMTGYCTQGGQGRVQDASLRLKVLKLASRNRTPTSERDGYRRMLPADYFGLFYDKIVEEQMPRVQAFVERVNVSEEEIPMELLYEIAEFASEPFSLGSRDGLEMQYLANIW